MRNSLMGIFIIFVMLTFVEGRAAEISVDMYQVTSEGAASKIGVIKIEQTTYGTIFTPNLSGLPPGVHGFHVHAMNDCGPMTSKDGHMMAGMAAGGHYDPGNTNFHAGPYGSGHLGDLPVLYVDAAGMAVNPVLAPRLKLTDLSGRSLMIHEGGDNYSDTPKPLGGGGARIACGAIK